MAPQHGRTTALQEEFNEARENTLLTGPPSLLGTIDRTRYHLVLVRLDRLPIWPLLVYYSQ
jgi:hypothetical protein